MNAITKGNKKNFDTLIKAARNGDLALVECFDKRLGKPVAVVCAVSLVKEGDIEGKYEFLPFATMFDDNPYDILLPPNPEGGFYSEEDEPDIEPPDPLRDVDFHDAEGKPHFEP